MRFAATSTTCIVFGIGLGLMPGAALAQASEGAGASALTARAAEVDTSIPESPGFSVIGFSPTQVIDPSAARVTLASLASYVDSDGNLKPGFALGGTPYLWLHPKLTLKRYRDLTGLRAVLARTQVTGAFADGGDGEPDKIGFGFTFDVFNGSDYRHDIELYDCVNAVYAPLEAILSAGRDARRGAAYTQARKEANLVGVTLTVDQEYAVRQRATAIENEAEGVEEAGFANSGGVQRCRDDAKARYAQRESLTFAGGWALRSKGGGLDRTESDGGSFWAAYRRPLGDAPAPGEKDPAVFYGTAFARYDVDRKEEVTTGVFQRYDRVTLAALGGYERPARGFKVSFNGGYEHINYRGAGPLKDKGIGFWAATATQELVETPVLGHTWLEVQIGSGGSLAKPDEREERVKVSLRFGLPQR